MIFWRTFIESVKLPSKKALFKLNRTGMDIVVIYIFILLLFVSIPALIEQITTTNDLSSNLHSFFQVMFFFIFYFLPLNLIVFLILSLVAFIGLGITKLMRRKLRFAILWKMCAFSTTVPFAIYTIAALFFPINNMFLWFSLLYTFFLLIKMISIYPKRRIRLKQAK